MSNLRFAEDIVIEQGEKADTIYCIVPDPSWKWYDEVDCPLPIRVWLENNFPEVKIERIAGFRNSYGTRTTGEDEPEYSSTDSFSLHPIFYVGFKNSEQVERFVHAWSTPPLDTPNDFQFVTVTPLDLSMPKKQA